MLDDCYNLLCIQCINEKFIILNTDGNATDIFPIFSQWKGDYYISTLIVDFNFIPILNFWSICKPAQFPQPLSVAGLISTYQIHDFLPEMFVIKKYVEIMSISTT